MGWTYVNNASRSDIIAECVADQTLCSGDKLRTLRKSFRGNVMYSVLEIIRDGKSTKSINVTLLGRSKFGWGYKIMDECEGPCYYHCPLSFLDEVSEPQNELAKNWRETVRREAAARSAAKAQKRSEPVDPRAGHPAPLVAQWHDAFAAIHRATEVVERLTIEADVLAALDAAEELVRARYEAVYAERLNALPPGHHQDHEGRHFPNPTTDAP